MKHFFSEKEDMAFSAVVLRYNSLDEGSEEKLMLESKVKDRTKILLYLIPQRNLYLPEEDASAFLIDIIRDIDRIVDSFRISGLTYNKYLSQICRYRCMQYLKKKRTREFTEKALLYSDLSLYDRELKEDAEEYNASNAKDVGNLSLTEIMEKIIKESQACDSAGNPAEGELRKALSSKVSRRRFLTFLLSLPETENDRFMNGVSRVLSVDKSLVTHFYLMRHEELRINEDDRKKAEEIAGRYWQTMARLRHAIAAEDDDAKAGMLHEAYQRTKAIYEKRREKLAKSRKGLTQRQIAELTHVPRSTISNDICRTRELLESVMEMVQM